MHQLYTCGTWTVVTAREEEFVCGVERHGRLGRPKPLPGANRRFEHREKRNVFLSFGSMGEAEVIEGGAPRPASKSGRTHPPTSRSLRAAVLDRRAQVEAP